MSAAEIEASLKKRGINYVSHTTSCDRLPGIVKQGGVLSFNQRQLAGIPEPATPHYWGAAGKKEALADYVICSFMPPWGMIKDHQDELAIILLDAKEVCCAPGTLFCPGNSARNEYPADEIPSWHGSSYFNACFPNLVTYQAGDSEIFVKDKVPFAAFRGIIFCDEVAKEYWLQEMGKAWDATNPKPEPPPMKLKIGTGSGVGFSFPGNWSVSVRIRL